MPSSSSRHPYCRAVAAGVTAGLRTMTALAAVAHAVARDPLAGYDEGPFRILRSRPSRIALTLAAAGELIADKLPATPSRLELGPLAGRMLVGGLAGAALSRGYGGSALVGLLCGAAAAYAGAQAGNRLRARLVQTTGIPDPLVAVAEDGLALVIAAGSTAGDG